MKSLYDLHIHSEYSDGDLSIDEIIERCKDNNVKCFAICDHDNMDSIKYLKDLELKDIEYINGVEISSYFKNYGIHILGLNMTGDLKSLERLIKKINSKRKKRMKEILKKIKVKNGIKIKHDDLDILLNSNNIGKKQLSKILIKYHLGDSLEEIRNNYLTGLHCKTSYRANIEEVCKCIKKCNGYSILAHPKEYEDRFNIKLEDNIEYLIDMGIDGIEVYHSIHNKDDIERYLDICHKYNLLISGGSDFHNGKKIDIGDVSKEELDNIEYFTVLDK